MFFIFMRSSCAFVGMLVAPLAASQLASVHAPPPAQALILTPSSPGGLHAAAEKVMRLRQSAADPINVVLADGVYHLGGRPLHLSSSNVSWSAAVGARVQISGGLPVDTWRPAEGDGRIWAADCFASACAASSPADPAAAAVARVDGAGRTRASRDLVRS